MTGLSEPLRTDVALKQSRSLDVVVLLARAYEQRLGVAASPSRTASWSSSKPWSTMTLATSSVGSVQPSVPTWSTVTKKFSPAEIADRRKKGLCFKCDEYFVLGHGDICKQLFTIELIDNAGEAEAPTISLHALTRIQPCSGRTMQVMVFINGAQLSALLDSGSTHNFVDSSATMRAGLALMPQSGLRIAVANGDRVSSPDCCRDLCITIGGEPFSLDCYSLDLGSFDMVLGVQWLKSLGPILWDFSKRTIAFICNGHRVL
jgi:hypothetical protein